MNIYFISGLGAECTVFDEIELPQSYNRYCLEWIQPYRKEPLTSYALRMAEKIDTSKPFILVGLSFGGIIAQEIAAQYQPEKVIIISSIKSEKEMPKLFTFSKYTRGHKLIPTRFFTSDKVVSYAFFRKIYSKRLPDIRKYFTYRDNHYLRWSFNAIVNWKSPENIASPVYHIHGTKDPLFPIHKIKNPIVIDKGNHLMILTKAKKISEEIYKILEENK